MIMVDMYEVIKRGGPARGVDPLSYDAEVRKRLAEQVQRRAFGATGASPAAPGVPPAPPISNLSAIPTFMKAGGAISRFAQGAMPWLTPAVETGRVVASALDPEQTKGETALRVGMGAGRVAGAALGMQVPGPWWLKGAAATAGYLAPDAAEAIAGAFGGGAVPAPKKVPSIPPPPMGQWGAEPDIREGAGSSTIQGEAPGTVAPAFPPVVPFTAEDIRGTRRPAFGTGAFMNSRGEVTNLDTRASAPGVVSPEANFGVAGNMVGALMNQRRAAATGARGLATNKMLMDYALKAPAAQESANKAALHAATLEQAKRAADAGASASDVSLILAGRAPVSPTFGVVETVMPDKTGAIPVLQRSGPGAGTIQTVTPRPAATTATAENFAADVKRLGSKEAVLREYARRNITPPKE